MLQAVAIVVGAHQLKDGELSLMRDSQVNAEAEAGGGGEGQPQAVTLTRKALHTSAGRHVVQNVYFQKARLLLWTQKTR